ncbi:MAG: hypothetical protein AAGI48_16010 [Verrucomicrobiota bacterium]
MKRFNLLLPALLLFFVSPLQAGTYADSLDFFQFESSEKLKWEQDDENNEMGLGVGSAKNAKGGVYVMTSIDMEKLEWDLETYPDSTIEDFEKSANLKKLKDVTKDFDDGTKKRYVELSFSAEGKKVKAWLICAQKDDRLSVVMITCNQNGASIAKAEPSKILRSLEVK